MNITPEDLFEQVTAKMVELGATPQQATTLVENVLDAVESAAMSAVMTLDVGLMDLPGAHRVAAFHLALQVLQTRLASHIVDLHADLVEAGVKINTVPLGVSTHG